MRSGTAERVLAGAVAGAAYFAAGKLGLRLAVVHEAASAVWAPAGIAVAAYLLAGPRIWPALFAASFLVNATTLYAWTASLGIAGGNTASGLLAAALVERFAGGRRAFESVAGVFRFAGLAGALSTAFAAAWGPLCLLLAGLAPAARLPEIMLTWWLGDATGVLLVAPLVLLWARPGWRAGAGETAAFVAALAGVTALDVLDRSAPLGFLTLPLMMWAAFRFGLAGTAAASAAVAALALWSALHGRGSYVGTNPNETLLIVQAFMGVSATTCLAVAAAVEERLRRLRETLELNAKLDARKAELVSFHRLLSHDVSNVAAASLAILDRLLLAVDGPLTPGQEDLLRRAYRQSLELNRMTENARLLFRLREAGREFPPEEVDVRAVLRKTLETVRMMHFDRPFDVETSGLEELRIRGSVLLESLLLNLLDNAVRHTARGKRPSIRVRAAEVDGGLSVSVRGGEPADAERLRALLDPRRAARKPGGHGLGLTLVKEIVEREGGSVRVGTAKDEAGERFEVELRFPRS